MKKSTVIYGKLSVPIFQDMIKFTVLDSYIKNPEFVWRPTSEKLEYLILLNNDYYGIL
jgi:hypothetical protein